MFLTISFFPRVQRGQLTTRILFAVSFRILIFKNDARSDEFGKWRGKTRGEWKGGYGKERKVLGIGKRKNRTKGVGKKRGGMFSLVFFIFIVRSTSEHYSFRESGRFNISH